MQETKTYLELVRERGKRGWPLERVYRQLFNRNHYLAAYGKIYRNAGAMTPGVTGETADRMSLEKIDAIIASLRTQRYQWQPARRTYIPKKNGKKRPVGMPVWSDKLLGEVVRMILDAYFEPRMSEHSHGFRTGRGCHTALREIYYNWAGTTWFIEGDISDCFNRLDHEMLLATLKEHIHDGRFLYLIEQMLDAGYLEDWTYHQTHSGVPQGGIVSPVLSNILLDKLDTFVESVLIPQYSRGIKRKANNEYHNLIRRASPLFKKGQTQEARALRRRAQRMPSQDPNDPGFRRLKYCRYADDFLLGFIGPKEEAEEIKRQIRAFLLNELRLELSEEKTLVTHARSEAAKFLGYHIRIIQWDLRHRKARGGYARRSVNGRVGLQVPREVLLKKCDLYKKKGKVIHRAELAQENDYTIINTYQLVLRGVANYYKLAYNMHTLAQLRWVMEQSLVKTLAAKHKMTVPKVYAKYATTIEVEGTTYKGLRATLPRKGKDPLVALWGGVPLKWDIQATLQDKTLRSTWGGRSELEKRLLAQVCELCAATSLTDRIEVHHIRALKDLNQYPGREKPLWVQTMAARKRKTLVLCHTCHMDIQYGRPLRRRSSRSKDVSITR